jgi:hypothetical protein
MRKNRISAGKQRKLLEYFGAGTTARTAAGLVRVNKTTAADYYHRLRELIYLAVAAPRPSLGRLNWIKAILVITAKANAGAARRASSRSLAC